ncbi:MAG: NAD-dependent epimerase/dehydratase family protein [Nitrospira sp.]|nr:NAD-dependent epimerase/dehydratase family protein [Nitrospira sp.]MDH4302530.1 NAD-dependent epimerase/dehydratase family protein [Nitrospira sp.]MDH5193339.1 NAD-dependent epimerase/dehydratase family protein [Nitrospira sp.]
MPFGLQQSDPNRLRGTRVLITGGLGFIGSNLAIRLVREEAEVTIVDSMIPEYGGHLWNIEPVRDRVRINIADVRDEHAMKYLLRNCDYLFNLAGQTSHLDSMEHPSQDLDINAKAQLSILESCRQHNRHVKIVFAGTRQIYGKPHYLPVDERHPVDPVDVNGINKLAGELYHQLYYRVHGIRAVVLRLTNTYGPRMRVVDARQTFLGIWIRRLLEGAPILVYGDGRQVRDFNYVEDVVDAMLLAALSQEADGETFNLGDEHPLSLTETAELLIRCYGRGSYKLVPFPPERKSIDIGDYYGDFRKISGLLSWKPAVSLADGLERTVNYYAKYGERYWPSVVAA